MVAAWVCFYSAEAGGLGSPQGRGLGRRTKLHSPAFTYLLREQGPRLRDPSPWALPPRSIPRLWAAWAPWAGVVGRCSLDLLEADGERRGLALQGVSWWVICFLLFFLFVYCWGRSPLTCFPTYAWQKEFQVRHFSYLALPTWSFHLLSLVRDLVKFKNIKMIWLHWKN